LRSERTRRRIRPALLLSWSHRFLRWGSGGPWRGYSAHVITTLLSGQSSCSACNKRQRMRHVSTIDSTNCFKNTSGRIVCEIQRYVNVTKKRIPLSVCPCLGKIEFSFGIFIFLGGNTNGIGGFLITRSPFLSIAVHDGGAKDYLQRCGLTGGSSHGYLLFHRSVCIHDRIDWDHLRQFTERMNPDASTWSQPKRRQQVGGATGTWS